MPNPDPVIHEITTVRDLINALAGLDPDTKLWHRHSEPVQLGEYTWDSEVIDEAPFYLIVNATVQVRRSFQYRASNYINDGVVLSESRW